MTLIPRRSTWGPGSILPLYPVTPIPTQPQETVVTTFASGHGYSFQTAGVGSQADDTAVFLRGLQSLRLTTDAINGPSWTRKSGISPAIDMTGKVFKMWVLFDHPENITELQISAASTSFTDYYSWRVHDDLTQINKSPNTWIPLTFPFTHAVVTGSPSRSGIVAFQLRVRASNGNIVKTYFGGISAINEQSAGQAVVTFDDGYATVYTVAAPYMAKYGFRGTAYIIPSRIGTTGYMTLAQMISLQQDYGWCIACHHDTAMTLFGSQAAVEEQIKAIKKTMLDLGLNSGIDHFAYPNGAYDETNVLPIIRRYFRTARTIANYPETNPAPDWHRLRVKQVQNTAVLSTATLNTSMTNAATDKSTLVLVYHKIETPDSATSQRSPASFQTDMDNLKASGLSVVTISEAYK